MALVCKQTAVLVVRMNYIAFSNMLVIFLLILEYHRFILSGFQTVWVIALTILIGFHMIRGPKF